MYNTKSFQSQSTYMNNNTIEMQSQDLTDEDDSIINSLPDMNEIESYGHTTEVIDFNIVNKYMATTNNTNNLILSPRSSISSVSSSTSLNCSSDTSQQMNNNNNNNNNNGGTQQQQQPGKKMFTRNVHCVKEKIRRDRIKFSCNELRRLIPNLNGVKTDMASLLETSVLWIQLINANIPEQLLINVQSKLENLKLLRDNHQYSVNQKLPLKNLKIQSKDTLDSLHMKQETYSPLPLPSLINSPFSLPKSETNFAFNQSVTCNTNINHQQFMPKPSKWLYSNRGISGNGGYEHNMTQFVANNANNNNCNEFADSAPSYYSNNNKFAKKPIDFNNNSMYLDQIDFTGNLQMDPTEVSCPPNAQPIIYYNHHQGHQIQPF
jgi:hypothetical protein